MKQSLEDVRIRLIQIRLKPDVELEEQQTFIKRCKIRPDQLLPTNALKDILDERVLDDVDAVMIGGAGAYSVTRTYSWTRDLERLIHGGTAVDELAERFDLSTKVMRWIVSDYWDRRG